MRDVQNSTEINEQLIAKSTSYKQVHSKTLQCTAVQSGLLSSANSSELLWESDKCRS